MALTKRGADLYSMEDIANLPFSILSGGTSELDSGLQSVWTTMKSFDGKQIEAPPGTYEETGCVASGDQVVSFFHTTLTKNLKTTETRH